MGASSTVKMEYDDKSTCKWTAQQESDDWRDIYDYEIECKKECESYMLKVNFKYCPYCGKEIEEVKE